MGSGRVACPGRSAALSPDHRCPRPRYRGLAYSRRVYFTDRGIEELQQRRGEEEVTFEWLADRLRAFVDLNPEFETAVERLATFLARDDDPDD